MKSHSKNVLFSSILAVIIMIKLMFLILYHTLRYPLQESYIDREKGTIWTPKKNKKL